MAIFQPLVSSTNKLTGRYTADTGPVEEVSLGNNLVYTNSTLNAASYLKAHVDVATTAALTVTSSGSGVGQTLTNADTQAAIVIDGVTLAVNDRVLVKDQATGSQNGIYTVTDIGSVATNWVLTRATDADGSDAGLVNEGMQVTALNGTANARIIYILTTANPITVGSTALTFLGNNAGGLSGSGTANRVAYFDSSGVLTTTAFLDVDGTEKTLRHVQTAATGNTVVDGVTLINSTTATVGNQMYSGALTFIGQGWKTAATAQSMPCGVKLYNLPTQSTNTPIAGLYVQTSLNNAAYGTLCIFRDSAGARQLLMTDGSSAGNPGYSYFNDNDTGHRRTGTNACAFVAGGADIAGYDVNGLCVGTLGMNNAQFGSHPTTTTKHGAVWRSRNSIAVDYFAFQNDSATQEASLFRTSGTSGDWKWRMTGGTAALPSYSFYSQTSIGMFAGGTNILSFSVNGTEGARLTTVGFSSMINNIRGKIHAGHSVAGGTHASTLVVNNTNAGSGGVGTGPYTGIDFSHFTDSASDFQRKASFGFEKITTNSRGDFVWALDGAADDNNVNYIADEKMRLAMDGNLGIGTGGTVSAKLHVQSTSTDVFRLSYDGSNYMTATVSSSGLVNLNAFGSSAAFYFNDHIYMLDGKDFSFGGTTGTKIGQGTSEKLSFWGQTPIARPSSTGETTGFTAGAGSAVDSAATFTGNVGATAYTLNDIVKHLKNIGLIAS